MRRSFGGGYSPLYQAAYMLGGLQLRALRGELVGSGRMTDCQFHDAVFAREFGSHRAFACPSERSTARARVQNKLAFL